MKQPRDLAQRYLAMADRDINTMRLLAPITESDDEAIGFHAQQAVVFPTGVRMNRDESRELALVASCSPQAWG